MEAMTRKTVLIDASSAILLHKANLLEEVAALYRLITVLSVYDELTAKPYSGAARIQEMQRRGKIRVLTLPSREGDFPRPQQLAKLDQGEKDTIRLFLTGQGDFIITDDGAAARYCTAVQIPFINALLIPIIARFHDRLPTEQWLTHFNRVKFRGRYAQWVIDYARNCTQNDLLDFMP